MKSSPPIWHYVVSVKSSVKILSNFVAFLENTDFINNTNTNKTLKLLIFLYSQVILVKLFQKKKAKITILFLYKNSKSFAKKPQFSY